MTACEPGAALERFGGGAVSVVLEDCTGAGNGAAGGLKALPAARLGRRALGRDLESCCEFEDAVGICVAAGGFADGVVEGPATGAAGGSDPVFGSAGCAILLKSVNDVKDLACEGAGTAGLEESWAIGVGWAVHAGAWAVWALLKAGANG